MVFCAFYALRVVEKKRNVGWNCLDSSPLPSHGKNPESAPERSE
jgi:hypothetical protein